MKKVNVDLLLCKLVALNEVHCYVVLQLQCLIACFSVCFVVIDE